MRTTSRVYDSYAQAERAVRELKDRGIAEGDISLIANKYVSEKYDDVEPADGAATGAGVGAALGGGAGLLTGLGLIAIPGLGPVVAAGWLAAAALGAVGGAVTGGVIGALVDAGVPEEDAHVYSEAVRRGGTMVTVRYPEAMEEAVMAALATHGPIDAAGRRREYEQAGWEKFDPDAPAYMPEDTDSDRLRRRM